MSPINARSCGAKGDGITDDSMRLQAAIDALPAEGGSLYIPAGHYKLKSRNLGMKGKSNVTIYGDGRGATIIDASEAEKGFGSNTLNWWAGVPGNPGDARPGILVIDGATLNGPAVENIAVTDITFQGSISNPIYMHLLCYGHVDGITFERCAFRDCNHEGLFTYAGDELNAPSRVRVKACDFFDMNQIALNTNSDYVREITITECFFENVRIAINVIGCGVLITGNIFRRVKLVGCAVMECKHLGVPDAQGMIVSNNVFIETGYGREGNLFGSAIWGQGTFTECRSNAPEDRGILISGNVILNSVSDVEASFHAISVSGSCNVVGNHISGLSGKCPGWATAFFIGKGLPCYKPSGPNEPPPPPGAQTMHFSNNVLDRNLNVDGPRWKAGFYIDIGSGHDDADTSLSEISIYFSNNRMLGVDLGLWNNRDDHATNHPFISLSGDVLNGYIRTMGSFKSQVEGYAEDYINDHGELNDIPLFGTTNSVLSCSTSPGLCVRTLANDPRPSVKLANLWKTADNAQPIIFTYFTQGVSGQIIRVFLGDNATIQHDPSLIVLRGQTSITGPNKVVSLLLEPTSKIWYEV